MGSGGANKRKKEVLNEHKPIDIDIINAMRKCICKIKIARKEKICYGTGFFMKISDTERYLITNYHVIDSDTLNEKIEIEIWNKKGYILDPNVFNITFLEDPKDITAFEINDLNNIFEEVEFLNYDKNFEDGYLTYENADVFTIQHPLGKKASCSSGKIVKIYNYQFDHNIATESGSSGCPILLLNDNINLIKVIGIHKNGDKEIKINGGTFIGEIIKEIKKDSEKDLNKNIGNNNYIIGEIYIEDIDIYNDIRIINSYEEYMRNERPKDKLDKDRMNEKEIKNCKIKINDELIPFNYFYQFKKEGKYIIKYELNNYLTKANDIFNKCENLIQVDLSRFNSKKTKNICLMFNICDKLKEIKGIDNVTINKIQIPKIKNFHIINNIKPFINIKNSNWWFKRYTVRVFKDCFKNEGYQIFSFQTDTLIGVIEGPPNTPYENGFFLFKMIFPSEYPFRPPNFFYKSKVFHPNISEYGKVSIDILKSQWSPATCKFDKIIYSVQSLFDDPNTDEFLNEKAAKMLKNNRSLYDKTVRGYTYLFASYQKFLEDINNMNTKMQINNEEKFIYSLQD